MPQLDELDTPSNQECSGMDRTTGGYISSKSLGKMEGEAFDRNPAFVLRGEADDP